ncbi:MAG: bacillithiol biosynthesis cysteine-adding enzyme BshC [Cytophagaceae bacterium]|jgi:bacillithiol biosynthesis cysteine-adding enzyme BshC|nr:bacillithiol biosynthesis cysteine-adding enzyme BshC [Cytophagaceae bacterium]
MSLSFHTSTSFDSLKGKFSSLFRSYISSPDTFSELTAFSPTKEGIAKAIQERSNYPVNRPLLVDVLQQQYQTDGISLPPFVNDLIQPTTFTITTGQQIGIGLGPFYTVLKIIAAIRYSKWCSIHFPENKFIPVFWMATEDHDIQEIQSLHVFSKEYTWITEQTGAVGRMKTDGIAELFDTIPDFPFWVKEVYATSVSLSQATRRLVHELFKDYPILILDGDDAALKQQCIPLFKKEVIEQAALEASQTSTEKIKAMGWDTQVYVRPINLFYLVNNRRERLVKEGDSYLVPTGDKQWTEAELLQEIEQRPEHFSPNVVLRPVYETTILPDVVYVGGPGEMAYWIQLLPVFQSFGSFFPVLFPRLHLGGMSVTQWNMLKQYSCTIEELSDEEKKIRSKITQLLTETVIDFTEEKNLLLAQWTAIEHKVLTVDTTMVATVKGDRVKVEKMLLDLEKKVQKALERKQDVPIQKVLKLKEKIFPNDGLMERKESLWTWYINSAEVISNLVEHPFDGTFEMEWWCYDEK